MAYTRSSEDSDTYTYKTNGGYVCSSCNGAGGSDVVLDSLRKFRDHLIGHVEAGDNVPEHAFERIEREILVEDSGT